MQQVGVRLGEGDPQPRRRTTPRARRRRSRSRPTCWSPPASDPPLRDQVGGVVAEDPRAVGAAEEQVGGVARPRARPGRGATRWCARCRRTRVRPRSRSASRRRRRAAAEPSSSVTNRTSRSPSWPNPPATPPPSGSSTREPGERRLVARVEHASRRSCRARATQAPASWVQAVRCVPVRLRPSPVASSARWKRRLLSSRVAAPAVTASDTDPSHDRGGQAVPGEVQRDAGVDGRTSSRRRTAPARASATSARGVRADLHRTGCEQVARAAGGARSRGGGARGHHGGESQKGPGRDVTGALLCLWAGAGSNRRPITFQAIARTN